MLQHIVEFEVNRLFDTLTASVVVVQCNNKYGKRNI